MTEPKVRAPELSSALHWLNVEHPPTLAAQRGKVVLLDFWTYCCINCMHVLPDLRYLEEKYPDTLTVIGIHSPKFANERVDEQVEKAIRRYGITHPVANDPSFTMWKEYGIKAWPSIIFINPFGYVIGVLSGEGRRDQLDQMIAEQIRQLDPQIAAQIAPPVSVKSLAQHDALLRYPGKVEVAGDQLFISDSGNNRIIHANTNGELQAIYGNGAPGLADGVGFHARFHEPQGMCLVDSHLFVADRQNHAIRCIELDSQKVTTVAGTGEQGRTADRFFTDPKHAQLNSPWDLAFKDGVLYIAMAGRHQIWSLDLQRDILQAYAGSGREDVIDGENRRACFAQPSGLTFAGNSLYVADAETSAIRQIRCTYKTVSTIAGTGLFDFGDEDGVGKAAKFQHPLGICADESGEILWIIDTYNHKLKKILIESRVISQVPLDCDLDEPGGLCVVDNVVWIANTNRHEVVKFELLEGLCEVVTLRG